MNGVDRNLLRLAIYEMLYVDDVDVAITIDECVELAKAYGTDESSRFVNGLLGRVADDLEAGVDVIAAARAEAERREEEARAAQAAAAGDEPADAEAATLAPSDGEDAPAGDA